MPYLGSSSLSVPHFSESSPYSSPLQIYLSTSQQCNATCNITTRVHAFTAGKINKQRHHVNHRERTLHQTSCHQSAATTPTLDSTLDSTLPAAPLDVTASDNRPANTVLTRSSTSYHQSLHSFLWGPHGGDDLQLHCCEYTNGLARVFLALQQKKQFPPMRGHVNGLLLLEFPRLALK